jgi:hypothetical protein
VLRPRFADIESLPESSAALRQNLNPLDRERSTDDLYAAAPLVIHADSGLDVLQIVVKVFPLDQTARYRPRSNKAGSP